MENDNKNNTEANNQKPSDASNCHRGDTPKDVIPDEVPRIDGPGGE